MSSADPEERRERSAGQSVRSPTALPASAASGPAIWLSVGADESFHCGGEVTLRLRRRWNHDRPNLRAR
jgi:hypothetical protein